MTKSEVVECKMTILPQEETVSKDSVAAVTLEKKAAA